MGKENLPPRSLRPGYAWGADKGGRDVGECTPEQFEARRRKQDRLCALSVAHQRFLARRELAAKGARDRKGDAYAVTDEDVEREKTRRAEMAGLRKDLYGDRTGAYAADPEWDDVVPIPAEEPAGALAAIAYPDDYAEGRFCSFPPQP